jgi:hypothetical protein
MLSYLGKTLLIPMTVKEGVDNWFAAERGGVGACEEVKLGSGMRVRSRATGTKEHGCIRSIRIPVSTLQASHYPASLSSVHYILTLIFHHSDGPWPLRRMR